MRFKVGSGAPDLENDCPVSATRNHPLYVMRLSLHDGSHCAISTSREPPKFAHSAVLGIHIMSFHLAVTVTEGGLRLLAIRRVPGIQVNRRYLESGQPRCIYETPSGIAILQGTAILTFATTLFV